MGNIFHWIFTVLFFVLCFVFIVTIGILLINGMALLIKFILKKQNGVHMKVIRSSMMGLCLVVTGILTVIFLSQNTATTPPIEGEDSIAELIKVDLNGESQWISVRGVDQNNEIILFLAGGPGGSQLAAVRHEMPELESEFVVVGWDQPGSAKSFGSGDELVVDDYIKDGLALTEYLCERFDKEKIYVIGESWGSALGVMLASERPERFHKIVSTGTMVDFLETELIDYSRALEISIKKGDTDKMVKLIENGAPPYFGDDVTWKSAEYLNYLGNEMNQNPEISNPGYQTFRDIFSQEYGILDKINYLRGIVQTFNHVYPQLYDVDLRESYGTLDVPVKFIVGKHDINAPTELADEYYNSLNAPDKEWVWFENSGHSPWINESDRFIDEIKKMKSVY